MMDIKSTYSGKHTRNTSVNRFCFVHRDCVKRSYPSEVVCKSTINIIILNTTMDL